MKIIKKALSHFKNNLRIIFYSFKNTSITFDLK